MQICKQTCHLDENRRCRDCGYRFESPEEANAAHRPPREVYVRASRPTGAGAFVEPGVEYRDGDSFDEMSAKLRDLLVSCDPGDEHAPEKIAMPVEVAIQLTWPDRAYFVEVHDPRGGWIQIFQPFGVPRNR